MELKVLTSGANVYAMTDMLAGNVTVVVEGTKVKIVTFVLMDIIKLKANV